MEPENIVHSIVDTIQSYFVTPARESTKFKMKPLKILFLVLVMRCTVNWIIQGETIPVML
jgi:hypothetical protein